MQSVKVFTPQNPIEMDCPICHRIWVPTMFDDCMLPACGCYGDKLDRDTPCESCGMGHAWQCKDRPGWDLVGVGEAADPGVRARVEAAERRVEALEAALGEIANKYDDSEAEIHEEALMQSVRNELALIARRALWRRRNE